MEDDAEGKRKKNFLRALAARFRRRKSWLVSRFITKTTGPSAGSEDAHKQPWEVCEGQFTQAQWEQFEEYVRSDEFQVNRIYIYLIVNLVMKALYIGIHLNRFTNPVLCM